MVMSSKSTEYHGNDFLISMTCTYDYRENQLSLKRCFDGFRVERDDDVININSMTGKHHSHLSHVKTSVSQNSNLH